MIDESNKLIEKYITGGISDFFTKLDELKLVYIDNNDILQSVISARKIYEGLYGKVKIQDIRLPENVNDKLYLTAFHSYINSSLQLFKDQVIKNELLILDKHIILLLYNIKYGK